MVASNPVRQRARATERQDHLVDEAACWLAPSTSPRHPEAVNWTRDIINFYRLEQGVRLTRSGEDWESILALVTALKRSQKATEQISESAFIDLFGNDESPLKEWHYEILKHFLSRSISRLEAAISNLDSDKFSKGKPRQDRGGKPVDLAKNELVTRCFAAFDHFRPGEASAAESGHLIAYVNAVYALAAGEEVDLRQRVRRLINMLSDECGRPDVDSVG